MNFLHFWFAYPLVYYVWTAFQNKRTPKFRFTRTWAESDEIWKNHFHWFYDLWILIFRHNVRRIRIIFNIVNLKVNRLAKLIFLFSLSMLKTQRGGRWSDEYNDKFSKVFFRRAGFFRWSAHRYIVIVIRSKNIFFSDIPKDIVLKNGN